MKQQISCSSEIETLIRIGVYILIDNFWSCLNVVGMTYRAYHGPSNMSADVPGVPTALAREDRLYPKGRMRQQPAGDCTEENRSRAMKTKLSNGCLAESRLATTRATEAKDGSDERHDQPQPISDRRPFPTTGSEAKGRGYASQMLIRVEGTL
jgi:hypothetical protein